MRSGFLAKWPTIDIKSLTIPSETHQRQIIMGHVPVSELASLFGYIGVCAKDIGRGHPLIILVLGFEADGLNITRWDTKPAADTPVQIHSGDLVDNDGLHLAFIFTNTAINTTFLFHHRVIAGTGDFGWFSRAL
jgi:hypothetical protein